MCDGLAQAWSRLKYGIGKDRFLARNVIEAIVISIGDDRCMRAAATCVGMNKRTVRRAIQRRSLLNDRSDGEVWAKIFRRKQKDALEQCVVDWVISWWTDETRVSPCKKDVRNKRISFKTKVSHATHWLEESQVSGFGDFTSLSLSPGCLSLSIHCIHFLLKISIWLLIENEEMNFGLGCCCHRVILK